MNRLARIALPLVWCALFFSPFGRATDTDDPHARAASQMTTSLDLEAAEDELAKGDPASPILRLEAARLAIYKADCGVAVKLLADHVFDGSDPIAQLREIATGCERVTAATHVFHDDGAAVEIRFQDAHDEALAPLMVDSIVRARDALTRDLGATWPKPTRVVVVRDLISLAAMTGLPYESARTTGTVAVAKWGRVTLLSPRASLHGYPWRDTLAHELTHLSITRATHDRAPLWLQEGLAKREEIRWRARGPFDDRPPPEEIAIDGIRRHIDVALDKLGPSIAMLPTAEAASVAFAEVTSFVRFLVERNGESVLPRLLAAIGDEADVETALVKASGSTLHQWDGMWRAMLAPRLAKGGPPPSPHGHLPRRGASKTPKLSPFTAQRLAELLLGRDHAAEALVELDAISPEFAKSNPQAASLRADALLRLGRTEDAEPFVASPESMEASYPPWWAIRGQWGLSTGDDALAEASFAESIAIEPFNALAACEADAEGETAADEAEEGSLCSSARAWGSVPVGTE